MSGYVPFSLKGLSGSVVGSAQGSILAWDTTAPAGWKDSSRPFALGSGGNAIGIMTENTTAATSGAVRQDGPTVCSGGRVWNTTASGSNDYYLAGFRAACDSSSTPSPFISFGYSTPSVAGGAWQMVGGSLNVRNSSFSIATTSTSGENTNTQVTSNGGATSYTSGLTLRTTTTTDATTSTVRESTALLFTSQVWNSGGTPANNSHQFGIKVIPTTGSAPTSVLRFGFRATASTTPSGNFSTGAELSNVGVFYPVQGIGFPAMTVAAPITATAVGQVVYCSNGDAGAKCLAMWDGSNWLRIVLGAAVSAT